MKLYAFIYALKQSIKFLKLLKIHMSNIMLRHLINQTTLKNYVIFIHKKAVQTTCCFCCAYFMHCVTLSASLISTQQRHHANCQF